VELLRLRCGVIILSMLTFRSSLVHVEGDAKMRSYEDAEGKKQTSLSITQRTLQTLSDAIRSIANQF